MACRPSVLGRPGLCGQLVGAARWADSTMLNGSGSRTASGATLTAQDPFEAESRRVLAGILGGTVTERDVPGERAVRDFDLVGVGGDVDHAVEVTSVQHGAVRATRRALEKLGGVDLGLTESWSISVNEVVRVAPIEQSAAALLNELSAQGVSQFGAADADEIPQSAADTVAALRRLGIVQAYAVPASEPPRLLHSIFGVGSLDLVEVTNKVQTEVDKPDNRRKLAGAPHGAHRHLFVGLDHSDWYVASQFLDDFTMPPPPHLPEEVDVVWIGVEDPATGRIAVLLRTEEGRLVRLDPDTGAHLESRPDEFGPPSVRTCPECGAVCDWRPTDRVRTDPRDGVRRPMWGWSAFCPSGHFESSGRDLTVGERESRRLGAAPER